MLGITSVAAFDTVLPAAYRPATDVNYWIMYSQYGGAATTLSECAVNINTSGQMSFTVGIAIDTAVGSLAVVKASPVSYGVTSVWA
jgi:hypothetical protein